MGWSGHVARIRDRRSAYEAGVGECEGKSSLGRYGRRWMDNIKVDFKEMVWKEVYWIDLGRDRSKRQVVVNMVINFRVPRNAGNLLTNL
jgi:hypothetical protein